LLIFFANLVFSTESNFKTGNNLFNSFCIEFLSISFSIFNRANSIIDSLIFELYIVIYLYVSKISTISFSNLDISFDKNEFA